MLLDCQIDCFEYLYKVGMTKSISKVAHHSHISQSALSQQIQKLEGCLECKLLTRSNKGVELTETGCVVQKYADNIIRTYKKMMEDLNDLDTNSNIIKIEACWLVVTYVLPKILYKIKQNFPKHHFALIPEFSDKIEQDVLNGICNLGFSCQEPSDSSLSCHQIGTDEIVLVALSNYKIPEEININDLLKYPLIMLNDKLMPNNILNEHLNAYGYNIEDLNILFNVGSIEPVKLSVLKGYGIAFLPYATVKEDIWKKQLKLINIANFSMDYDMYLIHNKNACLDNCDKKIIQYFKKNL